MKKLLLLSIVFLLFSCDTEPMSEQVTINPFVGEWEDVWDEDNHSYKESYIFTEYEFTYYFEGFIRASDNYGTTIEPFTRTDKGTYQADNSFITFTFNTVESSHTLPFMELPNTINPIEYSISNNKLALKTPRGTYIYNRIN